MAKSLDAPEAILACCRFLNPQYTVSRYPDAAGGLPSDLYDKFLGETLVKNSKKVME